MTPYVYCVKHAPISLFSAILLSKARCSMKLVIVNVQMATMRAVSRETDLLSLCNAFGWHKNGSTQ